MRKIAVLDQQTIDKIAAGEVVERPSSVVKELVENAIDAGATAVTVEITDGGKKLIRITDNGGGMEKDQVPLAFLRHATSKIEKVEDLEHIASLGFRGEALSSIAAVSQVELITKTPSALSGVRYVINGGIEECLEDMGAPEGTTFLVRNLFYNTPARSKFLKGDATEGTYVSTLIEQLALSHPEISFKYIQNRQVKLHTSGNSSTKDVIYNIYGRDIAKALLEVHYKNDFLRIDGFIGKPEISRGNRSFENYYINGRFVKNRIISKGIEDAYKGFLMQHKFPFVSLQIEMEGNDLDVNVHPSKMEVRFAKAAQVYDAIYETVRAAITKRELIPVVSAGKEEKHEVRQKLSRADVPEPFETKRLDSLSQTGRSLFTPKEEQLFDKPLREAQTAYGEKKEPAAEPVMPETGGKSGDTSAYKTVMGAFQNKGNIHTAVSANASSPFPVAQTGELSDFAVNSARNSHTAVSDTHTIVNLKNHSEGLTAEHPQPSGNIPLNKENPHAVQNSLPLQSDNDPLGKKYSPAEPESREFQANNVPIRKEFSPDEPVNQQSLSDNAPSKSKHSPSGTQMELFDEKLLSKESRARHQLIGQLFDTYWLVQFDNNFYIIDQHAAHEKVYYERFVKKFRNQTQHSQYLSPPLIVTLNLQEEGLLKANMDYFQESGFEIEHFGGREYCISAVPAGLPGLDGESLFLEMLDRLAAEGERDAFHIFAANLATMACKAAVKGNHRMSPQEADALIDELLTLENPYHCPHGRPTIIAMTKTELEKKFKRIL